MQMRLQVAREPAQEVKEVPVCWLLPSLLSRQEAVGQAAGQKPVKSSVGREEGADESACSADRPASIPIRQVLTCHNSTTPE